MKKVKNGNRLLVNIGEPIYVRHSKNDKHNDVTVVIMNLALPLRKRIFVTPEVLKAIEKVSIGFPDAKLRFNFKPEVPALLFTVKGKTECRGNDTPDQRIGDMVALAKAQVKASVIANKALAAIEKVLNEASEEVGVLASYFKEYAEKEKAFVAEEKYMKVLEKKKK